MSTFKADEISVDRRALEIRLANFRRDLKTCRGSDRSGFEQLIALTEQALEALIASLRDRRVV